MKMTKTERAELKSLLRRRERVAKSALDDKAAALEADLEEQLASEYAFDDDEVWQKATKEANNVICEAKATIAERCKELGIPDWAAPNIHMAWYGRGENAVAARRTELRRVGKAKINAYKARAKKEIERASVEIETRLVEQGLESNMARAFIEQMPTADDLMPAIDATKLREEIQAEPKARTRHELLLEAQAYEELALPEGDATEEEQS